jgi:hypothetical protein
MRGVIVMKNDKATVDRKKEGNRTLSFSLHSRTGSDETMNTKKVEECEP